MDICADLANRSRGTSVQTEEELRRIIHDAMQTTNPAHTEYLAEQITKIVLYVALAAVGLYFAFRPKKPPK